MDRGGVRHYYHPNRLYSTYALTDESGAVAERYAYAPYGEVTTFSTSYVAPQGDSRVGNPFTVTGRELDKKTQLLHRFIVDERNQ